MDHVAILTRAWELTWKHKILWIFGIFSAGIGVGFRSFSGRFPEMFQYRFQTEDIPQLQDFVESLSPKQTLQFSLGFLIFLLLVGLLLYVISLISLGGLITGFDRAERNEPFQFMDLLRAGASHFWRLLGVSLTLLILVFAAMMIMFCGTITLGVATLGLGLLCLFPLLCLLIPISVLLGSYIALAQVAVVIDRMGVYEAFSKAWRLMYQNLGELAVMTLILVLGGIIVSFLLAAPMVAIALPAAIASMIKGEPTTGTGLLISGLCLVVYLPVLIFLNGLLQTYLTGAWTLTYHHLTRREARPVQISPQIV